MKINLNFYNNAGERVQYVAHIKGDKLDHVVSPKGTRLSERYGKRIFSNSQRGIEMTSEARGKRWEVPRKYAHQLVKRDMRAPKFTGDISLAKTDHKYVEYNTKDMDKKIYVLFASNEDNPENEYWEPEDVEEYATFYKNTGYTNRMLKADGINLEKMVDITCGDYIDRGDKVLGYLFLSQ